MRVVFVGRDRRVGPLLAWYVPSLGITRRVWLYGITKEVDGHDALGLHHRTTAWMLSSPAVGAAVLGLRAMLYSAGWFPLGFGPVDWTVLAASFVPPAIVSLQTARRISSMLRATPVAAGERPIRYGPAWLVWAATVVPILGNLFFMAWTQTRLNRFWALERSHPERGVELDEAVADDPAFLVELGEAVKASVRPGSRFQGGWLARRRAAMASWSQRQAVVRAERAAVRAAGGSTPVWPFAVPRRPAIRVLHVVCGRCSFAFDAQRDPLAETPLLCPKCGMVEVIPALRDDPLAPAERAAVPAVAVDCPKCATRFHALRNLRGPTPLVCPTCGRSDTLPAPSLDRPANAKEAPGAQGKQGGPRRTSA